MICNVCEQNLEDVSRPDTVSVVLNYCGRTCSTSGEMTICYECALKVRQMNSDSELLQALGSILFRATKLKQGT